VLPLLLLPILKPTGLDNVYRFPAFLLVVVGWLVFIGIHKILEWENRCLGDHSLQLTDVVVSFKSSVSSSRAALLRNANLFSRVR
jgi:hypothetical protein